MCGATEGESRWTDQRRPGKIEKDDKAEMMDYVIMVMYGFSIAWRVVVYKLVVRCSVLTLAQGPK